ncbi:MAG: hypothetical protein P1U46_04070 [Patescibacteria group bacterium]|nr:hypothetical protein [Patescibacteria group bacterium]
MEKRTTKQIIIHKLINIFLVIFDFTITLVLILKNRLIKNFIIFVSANLNMKSDTFCK